MMSEGSRSVVGQAVFWRPVVPRPNNHTFIRKSWFVGLAAFGGKAQNHECREDVWFFGLGTPGIQKTTWPENHFGIPVIMLPGRTPYLVEDKSGPLLPQSPLEKVGDFAPHLFQWVLR